MLSMEDVEHVMRLARLDLSAAEREEMRRQLSDILEHVAKLQELDTAEVPPTYHVLKTREIWREDEVRPGLSREEALANAPRRRDGCFQVPRVAEEF